MKSAIFSTCADMGSLVRVCWIKPDRPKAIGRPGALLKQFCRYPKHSACAILPQAYWASAALASGTVANPVAVIATAGCRRADSQRQCARPGRVAWTVFRAVGRAKRASGLAFDGP